MLVLLRVRQLLQVFVLFVRSLKLVRTGICVFILLLLLIILPDAGNVRQVARGDL